MSLKGKTLFITGASRGIGLAIALRAARDGANIAVAAKTDTPHPKLPGTIHTDIKRFDLMHQVNARGTFLVSKLAIPLLEKSSNPHILMLSPPLDMQEKW